MQDRWAPPVRPEDLHTTPVPVVRVFDGFEERDHDDIQGLFLRHGYSLVVGGRHNHQNPLELSIDLTASFKVPFPRERALIASNASGIPLPETFMLEDALTTDLAVVAKDRHKNGGKNKFLLETREQKIRFAAWMVHVQRFDPTNENPTDLEQIERLRREVSSGHFYLNTGSNPTWNNGWEFEEFIEAPGDNYTSIRVVPDAYGEVHYGLITKSSHKKSDEKKAAIEPRVPIPGINLLDPARCTALLMDPKSPFYLDSKSVVSNIISGGKGILLDGNQIVNEEDRQLAKDMGINPDLPEIPHTLAEASRKIGIALRAGIPFMGIDFMQRTDGSFVLLEVNTGPLLFHGAFGEDASASQDILYYKMYERIIQGAKARHPEAFK